MTVATYGRGAYQRTVPTMTIVPEVVGDMQASAEAAIVEANLVVGTITTVPDAAVEGSVIAQIPVAGSEVDEGSTVDLTISSGPEEPVPVDSGSSGGGCALGNSPKTGFDPLLLIIASLSLIVLVRKRSGLSKIQIENKTICSA